MCLFSNSFVFLFLFFFQTNASHISGFTFQFLTFHKPKRKHYFSTSINISNCFNFIASFTRPLNLAVS